MLPFIVRSADESIRADLAQAAIAELNRRIAHRRDDGTASIDQQSELAHAIVAVVANTKSESAGRVVAFAKRSSDVDALIATYARASIFALNFDNVFAAGKQCSGHQLDRDVLAALCFEGLAPVAKPELKALTHPAICCLAILKGGTAKQPRTKKDLSCLFVGGQWP